MSENQIDSETLTAPPDFSGPVQNRKCTDIFCLFLLLASWAALTFIGVTAYALGDHRVVLYPMDYDGNICGANYGEKDMTDYKYLYPVNFYSGGVCVKECPELSNPPMDLTTLVTYNGVFQVKDESDEIPPFYSSSTIDPTLIKVADYSYNNDTVSTKTCTQSKCYPFYNPVTAWSSEGIAKGAGYAFFVFDSKSYMNRCIASSEALEYMKNFTTFIGDDDTDKRDLDSTNSMKNENQQAWLNNAYSDIYVSRNYILGFGLCIAIVIGFLYSLLLQIQGVLMIIVWGSILLTIAMIIGVGYYANQEVQVWIDEEPKLKTDREIMALQICVYIIWAFGGILFCLMVALRKKIRLAIGIVKESAKCVAKMPALILFPVLQCLGLMSFVFVWLVYAVHLASIGEITTQEIQVNEVTVKMRDFEYDENTTYQGWYLIFSFFWTSQFIVALGEIIIAFAVSKWFFSRDKSMIGNTTVLAAICQSLFYHAGTAAFGSLIIAIISTIRTVLAYIQKKAKQTKNKVIVAVLMCLQCCMWALEKFMKFLNKNAYIQTAIFGTSFCQSARSAFFLILRNAVRIGTLSAVSQFVVLIGQLFISVATAGSSYILIDHMLSDKIHSPIAPVLFIVFLSFITASMFMNVFSMVTNTILQCFIADEEMFQGSDQSFSSNSLKAWVENDGSHGRKNSVVTTASSN